VLSVLGGREVGVYREFLSLVFMAAEELAHMARPCCQTKTQTVRVTQGAEGIGMPEHRVSSRL
jgi:hypothetical protein